LGILETELKVVSQKGENQVGEQKEPREMAAQTLEKSKKKHGEHLRTGAFDQLL